MVEVIEGGGEIIHSECHLAVALSLLDIIYILVPRFSANACCSYWQI